MKKVTEQNLICLGWSPIDYYPQADITIFARNSLKVLQYGELKKGKFKPVTEEKVKKYQGGNW